MVKSWLISKNGKQKKTLFRLQKVRDNFPICLVGVVFLQQPVVASNHIFLVILKFTRKPLGRLLIHEA